MGSKVVRWVFWAFLMSAAVVWADGRPMSVLGLRCEYRVNPLGIDTARPRLSWNLESPLRGQRQTAYQILVASDEATLRKNQGDIWNTGKILSDRCLHIEYAGKPLRSGKRYYWKVRAWARNQAVCDWSEPAWWEMSLLSPRDWKGGWINDGQALPQQPADFYADDPAPLFRKGFELTKKIARGRLYITGLGYYEAFLNGQRVGDCVLDPGWTCYSRRVLYQTYDVTDLLKAGENCLGVTLGNGWYNPLPLRMWGHLNLRSHLPVGRPAFIGQLSVDYADGSSETIVSDAGWKVHSGPVRRNSIYLGEVYDARNEIDGWHQPGFDDAGWAFAAKTSGPGGMLQAQFQPPIRKTATIRPVEVTEPEKGVYIFDMGQNFAGWVSLKVTSEPGCRIRLRYGELLNRDGTLNPMTSVCGQIKGRRSSGEPAGGIGAPEIAFQQNIYITKGQGEEVYQPRFTWQAFRYVEVTGYPEAPTPDAVEGVRLNSDVEPAGSFACSNELFNRIQTITQWTFLSNLFSVQSDCPHRERFGYGGDLAVTSEAFMMNYDMEGFYAKAVRDWADAARPDGMLTDTAPFVGIQYCGPAWAMAHPLVLWQLYQYYGDKRLVQEQYPVAVRWFDQVRKANPEHLIQKGLSDHESLESAPADSLVTPLYYQTAQIMALLAAVLDRPQDVKDYQQLAVRIRDAYNAAFPDNGSGAYGPGTQAGQSLPLYCGLVPAERQQPTMDFLVDDIVNRHNGHLTTGIFGTRYMLDVLSRFGHAETACAIVNQRDCPGWGYMIDRGATTLWEHWKFSDNTYSHNHPMFGSVSEWLYKHVAGLSIDPEAVGFDRFTVWPKVVDQLDWAQASYRSVYGTIRSRWYQQGNSFHLELTVPIHTSATVYIPNGKFGVVTEGGVPAKNADGVQFLRFDNDAAVYAVQSGSYRFSRR